MRISIAILLSMLLICLAGLTLSVQARPLAGPLLEANIAVSTALTEPGSRVTYTATVNNPQIFSVGAEVSLPIPAELSYTGGLTYSLGAANYKASSRSVVWSGSIAPGETLQIGYAGTVSNPLRNNTVITGQVVVNDYFNPVYSDTTGTTVQSEPDMSPSRKSSAPAAVLQPGQVVTTVLRLENIGNSDTHVYLTETIPSCFSLGDVSVQDIVIGPDYLNWDFDLTAGGVHTLTYQAAARETCLQEGVSQQVILQTSVNDSHHPVFTMNSAVQFGEAAVIEEVYLPLIGKGGGVTCDLAEPNNSFARATVVTTDSPSQQVFSYDADVDYLTFEVTQAGEYTVQTANLGPDTDTTLYLYDQAYYLLDWNDDAVVGVLWSRISRYLEAGRYYLKAEDYNPRSFGCDHTYIVEVR